MKYAYIVLCYSDVCDHKSVVRNAYKNIIFVYCNDPKFSDRLVLANSADSDQTAPRGAV